MSIVIPPLSTCVGDRQRESVLEVIASNLEAWTAQVKQEKAVYHTLNKLSIDTSRKVLVAEAWVPVAGMQKIREILQQTTNQNAGSVSPCSVFQNLTVAGNPVKPV